jgi:hypothetical protein
VTSEPTDLEKLRQARSLLILLLAACRETRVALDGAAHDLQTNIVGDLAAIADSAEREINGLNDAIKARD